MANESSTLFLHRHPITEMKLKVDIGHVVVDRSHWEATLSYLNAHQDIRTEIHNASFGNCDPFEIIPDQVSEIVKQDEKPIE